MDTEPRPSVMTPNDRRPSKFRVWGEILASTGVMLSLIFVGLELRQNTAAVRASAVNELATGARELLLDVTTSADLSDLYRRWLEGKDDFAPTERTRIRLLLIAMLRGAENAFLQTRIGVVDSLALRGYGVTRNPAFQSPLFPALWKKELRERFHPDFASAMEKLYGLD